MLVNLTGAVLIEATLTDADLTGSNLTRAALLSANLTGAILTETNLEEAELKGADLEGSNPEDALSLRNTDLRGVKGLTEEQLEACKAKGAIIDEDTSTSPSQQPVTPSPPSQQSS